MVVSNVCAWRTLNGAEQERSELFGVVNERNESTTLIWACRILTYVLELLEEYKPRAFCVAYAPTRNCVANTYWPPPGGQKTCSKTRESFVSVLLGVSLQESKSQHILERYSKHNINWETCCERVSTPPIQVLVTLNKVCVMLCERTYIWLSIYIKRTIKMEKHVCDTLCEHVCVLLLYADRRIIIQ